MFQLDGTQGIAVYKKDISDPKTKNQEDANRLSPEDLELRRSERKVISLPVCYRIRIGQSTDSKLKDISEHGLCLEMTQELPQGSLIDMEIKVPGFVETISALGTVVWCRRSKNSISRYQCGIVFEEKSFEALANSLPARGNGELNYIFKYIFK